MNSSLENFFHKVWKISHSFLKKRGEGGLNNFKTFKKYKISSTLPPILCRGLFYFFLFLFCWNISPKKKDCFLLWSFSWVWILSIFYSILHHKKKDNFKAFWRCFVLCSIFILESNKTSYKRRFFVLCSVVLLFVSFFLGGFSCLSLSFLLSVCCRLGVGFCVFLGCFFAFGGVFVFPYFTE